MVKDFENLEKLINKIKKFYISVDQAGLFLDLKNKHVNKVLNGGKYIFLETIYLITTSLNSDNLLFANYYYYCDLTFQFLTQNNIHFNLFDYEHIKHFATKCLFQI